MGNYIKVWDELRGLPEQELEKRKHEWTSDSEGDVIVRAAQRLIASELVSWKDIAYNALEDLPQLEIELLCASEDFELTEHDIAFVRDAMLQRMPHGGVWMQVRLDDLKPRDIDL